MRSYTSIGTSDTARPNLRKRAMVREHSFRTIASCVLRNTAISAKRSPSPSITVKTAVGTKVSSSQPGKAVQVPRLAAPSVQE